MGVNDLPRDLLDNRAQCDVRINLDLEMAEDAVCDVIF